MVVRYYREIVRKKQVYFTKTCQRCLPIQQDFFLCLLYVDEVHAIGWNQLITFYRKAVDIVKKITGRENETEAVSEFKTRLKSFSLCLNKQPFPLNESNNKAFQKCRTKRGGKYSGYITFKGTTRELYPKNIVSHILVKIQVTIFLLKRS